MLLMLFNTPAVNNVSTPSTSVDWNYYATKWKLGLYLTGARI